jgi:hypothetical protein
MFLPDERFMIKWINNAELKMSMVIKRTRIKCRPWEGAYSMHESEYPEKISKEHLHNNSLKVLSVPRQNQN